MKSFVLLFVAIFLFSLSSLAQDYNMSTTTVSTCSGVFYDNGGSAANYSNSQSLTMTFNSDNGQRLSFNFQSFSLYSDSYDYMQIFDGPSNSYPLIGTYSGTNSPGIITSTGTALTFYFYSNSSSASSGWSANISCAGTPLTTYNMSNTSENTCSGVFYDNAGAGASYLNNEDYTMTFYSGTTDKIIFNFTHFALATDDTLFAYDGSSSSSPLIGAYTGTMLPEAVYSHNGNSITWRFKSNSVNVAQGWKALITCSPTSPVLSFNMQDGIRYTCGGTFYDNGGSTASYLNSTSKTQTFYSFDGNRISFNFQSFSLYNDAYDYLKIYDGPSSSYPLLGTYYGTNSPGIITSSGSSLTFYFYSNSTSSSSGWSANISCTTPIIPEYSMTSGSITTCNAIFSDNGGQGGNYQNNESRTMSFASGTSDLIIANFSHFDVYTEDTLFIFDGPNTSSPMIGAYTGDMLPEIVSSITGNVLTFYFKSNTINNSSGWRAFLSCASTAPAHIFNNQDGIRYTCGGNFYDDGGSSGNYYNNETRTMTFISNNNNKIRFDFSAFSLYGDGYDYLEIYDGPNISYPLIGKYLYTSNPGIIESSGTSLTFHSYTSSSSSSSGWAASISCTTTPPTLYPMTSGTTTTCYGIFTDNGGLAANYPNNENRTMTFSSGSSDKIIFTFSHFDIELGDTLFAYDGTSTASPLIGAYTGYMLPEPI
ncbi:MAG: hypothetical protein CVU05_15580, partial [Bacteroidetes bacterium HGW-Bacteroidetes-21]